MIHTTAPRPLRIGVAVVGVAGALALAGCAGTATDGRSRRHDSTARRELRTVPTLDGDATYTDGTYTARARTPRPSRSRRSRSPSPRRTTSITDVEVTRQPAEARNPSSTSPSSSAASPMSSSGKDIDRSR